MKEVENNIYKKKDELNSEKRKKHKHKHRKKDKYQHSDNSSAKSNSNSSSDHHSKKHRKEYTTPSLVKQKLADTNSEIFGLVGKDGQKIQISSNKSLGPDDILFKQRAEMKERENKLLKKNNQNIKSMSEDEKQKRRIEMENTAMSLDIEKMKIYSDKSSNSETENLTFDFDFSDH